MTAPEWKGSEPRSKPEYSFLPPNPKYESAPEYRQQSQVRYHPPQGYGVNMPPAYIPPASQVYYPTYETGNMDLTFMAIRVLWFLFIGIWLGFLWMFAAYALCATVIGLPLGLLMLNRLPAIMTLRPPSHQTAYTPDGRFRGYYQTMQYSFPLRAVYYLFFGWWAGMVWTILAYLLCLPIITLPVAMYMFDRIPAVLTLRRN